MDGRIVDYSEEWLRVIIHRSNTAGSVRVVVRRRSNPGTTPLQSPKVRGARPAPPPDGGLFSGISLVDANECDAITGRRLHRCRQRAESDSERNRWFAICATRDQSRGYSNPEVDALLDQAQIELDPRKQADSSTKVQAIAHAEIAIAPLFDQETIIAYRPYVKGLPRHITCAPSLEIIHILEHS